MGNKGSGSNQKQSRKRLEGNPKLSEDREFYKQFEQIYLPEKLDLPFPNWCVTLAKIWEAQTGDVECPPLEALDRAIVIITAILTKATEKIHRNQIDNDTRRLIETYARLFIFSPLASEGLLPMLSNHLKFRLKGKDLSTVRYKIPLTEIEKKALLEKKSLSTRDVARLFQVRRRQVQRWVEVGNLTKTKNGDFLVSELVKFSKRETKYGRLALDYIKLIRKKL
jgi:hypothetical protein